MSENAIGCRSLDDENLPADEFLYLYQDVPEYREREDGWRTEKKNLKAMVAHIEDQYKSVVDAVSDIDNSTLISEEAQESCNKFIKKHRQHFARKCKNMEDVFKRLLVSSDPPISSLQKLPSKRSKTLNSEALALLKAPNFNYHCSDNESGKSSDEEY